MIPEPKPFTPEQEKELAELEDYYDEEADTTWPDDARPYFLD